MLIFAVICCVILGSLAFAATSHAGSEGSGENGTPIKLVVGETEISAVLNDSRSSRELVDRLPLSLRLQKYDHDYCGMMAEPLPYDKTDLSNGWANGDISFDAGGNYFAILYKDEEISQQFGNLVTLGRITAPLSVMETLDQEITVRIELD